MRRNLIALACVLVASSGWSTALAQEAEYEAPLKTAAAQYREIVNFEVEPADAAAFEMAIEKIVSAARLAGLSEEYGWYFFRDGSDFTLVYPVSSMAYYDDDEQWMRQFQGTPGEATLMEAFGDFNGLHYASRSHVIKIMPEHSYRPEMPIENPNFVHVVRNWLKPGQDEAHAESTVALLDIIREINYPYEIIASEGVIGDGGLRVYAIPFDNMAAFYGDNGLYAHLAAAEKTEAWEALIAERMKLLRDGDDVDQAYVPGMSYSPAVETAQAGGCK